MTHEIESGKSLMLPKFTGHIGRCHMPLDYRLVPDSPLLRDGVFKRITSRPLRGDSFDHELEIELIRNGFDYLLHLDDPEDHAPFSLMQVDEFLALLSFPGIVWFVSNKVRIDSRQAALTILAGMPWPLWDNQERQDILLRVSPAQATLLKKVFKPTQHLLSILLSLPLSLPLGFPHAPRCNAQNIWRGIARTSNQDVMVIRHVAKALRLYLQCLVRYLLQCVFSEMNERGLRQS